MIRFWIISFSLNFLHFNLFLVSYFDLNPFLNCIRVTLVDANMQGEEEKAEATSALELFFTWFHEFHAIE